MTMTLSAVLKASLDTAGANLNLAKKDLKRFNVEVSASKMLRKGIAAQLTEIKTAIKSSAGGHRIKASVAARSFLRAQYNELIADCQTYKFQRAQMHQYIASQTDLVLSLDKYWEEAKVEEAK